MAYAMVDLRHVIGPRGAALFKCRSSLASEAGRREAVPRFVVQVQKLAEVARAVADRIVVETVARRPHRCRFRGCPRRRGRDRGGRRNRGGRPYASLWCRRTGVREHLGTPVLVVGRVVVVAPVIHGTRGDIIIVWAIVVINAFYKEAEEAERLISTFSSSRRKRGQGRSGDRDGGEGTT